jgi:high affinity Mn2+ porin
MSAGAWDYAADTRGYTWGLGSEWKKGDWRAAAAITLVPKEANALTFDMHLDKAFATQAELTHFHTLGGKAGQLQLTGFFNKAHMGNYNEAVVLNPVAPDVSTNGNYKNHKYGFVLGAAQALSSQWGAYARLSWNDGRNETWAFTEIDRSVNVGAQWRKKENSPNALGLGVVVNGLSTPHRKYLAAGGYGFIIGDGKLNYAPEAAAEAYYRFCFFDNRLQLSPDYQFVLHPAYNKDRGPVHFFALRAHVEL